MSFGTLYVVATPLGNLEDITFRAVRVLKEAPVIACEDTRRTVKLLNRYEIRTPMVVFHEYNKARAGAGILRRLREGESVALVSDAGTPAISDPGYDLVRDADRRGDLRGGDPRSVGPGGRPGGLRPPHRPFHLRGLSPEPRGAAPQGARVPFPARRGR